VIQDSFSYAEPSTTTADDSPSHPRDQLVNDYIHFTRRIALTQMGIWLLFFLEILLFFLFFTFFMRASILALNLALIFSTAFGYLLFRLHTTHQKPEKIEELIETFIGQCLDLFGIDPSRPENRVRLAENFAKAAIQFEGKERRYYRPPRLFSFLGPSLKRLSLYWHWYDIHKVKEGLLFAQIKEMTDLIKEEPTNLFFHTQTANAYVMLAGLYHNPRRVAEGESFLPSAEMGRLLEEKFASASNRAVEEFKILSEFAPNDPWVHEQLALSYHDLELIEKEIEQYQILLKLKPRDRDVLFHLGTLYFSRGENAKGLAIYKSLKSIDRLKAQELISYYGCDL